MSNKTARNPIRTTAIGIIINNSYLNVNGPTDGDCSLFGKKNKSKAKYGFPQE